MAAGIPDAHTSQPPGNAAPPVRLGTHDEVVAAATDSQTFSSNVSHHLNVPNGMDGEEHARYRAVVDKYLSMDRLHDLEPACRTTAADLLAGLPSGDAVDLVGGFGRRFAVRAQSLWLGWPRDLEDALVQWMADNHEATRSKDPSRTSAVAERFDAIVGHLVSLRRAAREEQGFSGTPVDVTDELAHDSVAGTPLRHEEIVSILRNWTAGDLGTISRCIGGVVYYLAVHPDLQQELRAGRDDAALMDAALDEMLRIDDPFLTNRRKVTRDTVLGGHPIRHGQQVLLDWVEANRDSTVFGDPDDYRPGENARHNLVYGIGPHICPGRALATMELRVATAELLAAFGSITLASDNPPVREEPPLGGFRTVHVVLDE